MSFPRYPTYQDSGVEWLGEVPSHWTICTVRRLVRRIEQGWSPECLGRPANPEEWGVLKAGCVNRGAFAQDENKALPDSLEPMPEYEVRVGDVLVSRASGSPDLVGSTALVGTTRPKLMLSDKVFRVHLVEETSSKFFVAAFGSPVMRAQIERAISGADGLANNLPQSALRSFFIAVPPVTEQRAVASFLEGETARIDALIAEQRLMVGLLAEQRHAIISHAVTKGLNPGAAMRETGVERFGAMPAHWNVVPIRYVARLESGHTPSRLHPEYWEECKYPWFSLGDVWQIREAKRDVIYETQELVSDLGLANSAARMLPKGTVMLSRTASVGFSAIMGVDMATTQDFANWVCGPRVLPEFLLQVFRSMTGEFRKLMYGSTHNTIYMPDILAFRMALPPVDEQAAILRHLAAMLATVDALTTEAQRAIDLLHERRTALISAAVTGQIDVRAVAPCGAA